MTAICEFVPSGGRLTCTACGRPLPAKIKQAPLRECRGPNAAPAEPPIFNDLSRGPCEHRGPLVAIEGCELCGQRGKPVETFRCAKHDIVTSEQRFRHAQPRKLTCGGCEFYAPNPATPSLPQPASSPPVP